MLIEILLGSVLILLTILLAGSSFWLMEWLFDRLHPWLLREPHRTKLMLVVAGASVWILGIVTAGIWIWALALRLLGLFATTEAAVYFALVSFTTLGYGDLVLPPGWRILGGMAAANGLLVMGLLTALMIEVLRHVHLGQAERKRRMRQDGPS